MKPHPQSVITPARDYSHRNRKRHTAARQTAALVALAVLVVLLAAAVILAH